MTDYAAIIAETTAQEERLQFTAFDLDAAWRLGSILRRLAAGKKAPVAIDIRLGEQQLFHAALPGSTAENDEWIGRKTRLVRYRAASSRRLWAEYGQRGVDFNVETGDPLSKFAAHGGGFPLSIVGVGVVGSIGVSGLPSEDDHALIVEGIEEFLATPDT